MLSCVQETADGVVVQLQVQPRSSRNQIVGLQGDALKIKLTSPPVNGAANKCCCEFMAKLFGMPKSQIVLIAGAKSRKKKVLVVSGDRRAINDVINAAIE